MKTINLFQLICLIVAFIFYGCQKDSIVQPKDDCVDVEKTTSTDSSFYIYYAGLEENGYATAIKLNKDWRASVSTSLFNNRYTFHFITVLSKDDINYKTESLEFIFSKLDKSCYPVVNLNDTSEFVKSIYLAVDYDVIEDAYSVVEESANNFIQIDTLDLIAKRVSGKFMVSFKKEDSGTTKKYNPEYVRFFNGEFHCNMNW